MRGRDKKIIGKEQKQKKKMHRKIIEERREYSKKFWEVLIAYFRLILPGPHRKPKIRWGIHRQTAR
jgi:hypothetical protein